MSQQPRLDFHALAPDAAKALTRFSFAARGRLEPRLKELITLRISQINGCAFCMDMVPEAALPDRRTGTRVAGSQV